MVLSTHISEQTSNIKGTKLWMVSEMRNSRSCPDRIDVYSFGMILWEIFKGKLTVMSDPSNKEISPMDLLIATAAGKWPYLKRMSHFTQWIRDINAQLWVTDPGMRPKIISVLQRLQRDDPKAVFENMDVILLHKYFLDI